MSGKGNDKIMCVQHVEVLNKCMMKSVLSRHFTFLSWFIVWLKIFF